MAGGWRVNPAHDDGPALLNATKAMGLEGVVAKRCDSRYLPGRRSRSWLKVKNNTSGWFDLVGWQPPSGKRHEGLVVAEDGRVVAVVFPALTSTERDKLVGVLAVGTRDDLAGSFYRSGRHNCESTTWNATAAASFVRR